MATNEKKTPGAKNEPKDPILDSKGTAGNKSAAGTAGTETVGEQSDKRLRYKAIDVKIDGDLRRVTQVDLDADEDLRAYIQEKFPEEFV